MVVDAEEKCIYCKKKGSSKEHVAPSSLGGNCTLNCVCVKCNGELSEVDQALAEHSPVAFSKIQHTPASAFPTYLGGYASMHVEGGREIAVRIGNRVATEVRPQFFADGNQIRVFAGDRAGLNDLIQFIDKQIERGRLARTRVFIAEGTKEPRFLMHRSDDAVVSAPSKERAAQFLAKLEQQWPEIKTKIETTPEQRQTHEQPSVLINMSLWPNEEYRAIAKIAFETLALLCGPAYVLQAAFDPIRDYIGGDVQLPVVAPEQLAVDSRFVQRLGQAFHLKFTERHGVLLFCSPPNLVAFVLLYGTHPYLVQLGTLGGERQWLRAYEFSYTRDGHAELDEVAFAKQVLELSPEGLGISCDQAREWLDRLNRDSSLATDHNSAPPEK
jgi:hypothetical protein